MKFSERLGYKAVKDQIQIESIDNDLRNLLWSVYLESFIKKTENWERQPHLSKFIRHLWINFFKLPIDSLPSYESGLVQTAFIIKTLRDFFFDPKHEWFETYDLLEFTADFASKEFLETTNIALEREKSAYRFIDKTIVQITSNEEVLEIEEALYKTDKFKSVNTHLSTALSLLSDRKSPDYRNSIKESISAVESICKIFTSNDKSTLGEALNKLEKENNLHSALKKSFSSLYGYTSDEGGIRHALTENGREIDFHEAKFLLVTCSAFINYLISKI
ncbi:hypothetical protein NU08_0958 [Flavobacterium anhuiense]|uniref:HEPN AbiJ-N-terminal domain-containing protein n=1 Tax=Flavobacterium anhuiense TaxID=459526 RepID=A0A444W3C2_9FLAO|nr:hypothetical protein [Flavobacterium anhuiense]RYJ40202.1 hypothetical protein NU08_0958 [Flavobacterium anhuiense]